MSRIGAVRIGTSGWVYKHWRDIFYPKCLPQNRWFELYARTFDTVEINFSFYRLPSLEAFRGWNEKAPDEFCFAVKGSRYITHIRRLLDPRPHLALFFEHAKPLKDHMGPVLWQLPPNFKRDDERLATFVESLPNAYRHTVEFRHPSWHAPDVHAILRRHDVALCVPDRKDTPGNIDLTTNWTYLRFHQGRGRNGNYSRSQLLDWAGRISECRDSGIDVWAYFNNDPFGHAIHNALDLRRMVDRR